MIALIIGLLSFLSPCTLPILPAYIAAMLQTDRKKQVLMTASFFIGLILFFTALGMSSSIIGSFLRGRITVITQISGVLVILAGVLLVAGKGFGGMGLKMDTPKTVTSSFLFGSILGLSWAPCVGPMLLAILALAVGLESAVQGGLLLMMYGLGLGIPLIALSGILQKLPRDGKFWKILKGKELKIGRWKIHSTSLISGVIFLILGYLIFSGGLYQLNKYVGTSQLQLGIYRAEEVIMQLLR